MAGDRSGEIVIWQPILDQVLAGRTENHTCPYCEEAVLEIDFDGFELKARCPSCGQSFYGQLA